MARKKDLTLGQRLRRNEQRGNWINVSREYSDLPRISDRPNDAPTVNTNTRNTVPFLGTHKINRTKVTKGTELNPRGQVWKSGSSQTEDQ